jgi:hypothetical protein
MKTLIQINPRTIKAINGNTNKAFLPAISVGSKISSSEGLRKARDHQFNFSSGSHNARYLLAERFLVMKEYKTTAIICHMKINQNWIGSMLTDSVPKKSMKNQRQTKYSAIAKTRKTSRKVTTNCFRVMVPEFLKSKSSKSIRCN